MDKTILTQYMYLQKELEDIKCRKERNQKQLENIRNGGTVLDSVKGTRRDGTFGSIKVEGFPYEAFRKKVINAKRYSRQIEDTENKLTALIADVESYIRSIEDSRMRLILRYKIVDGLSWNAVAMKLGGGNTADSVRMSFKRFFNDN